MNIAIVGLGLIGGSLAMSLRKAGFYVIGIARREETLDLAKEREVIDEGSIDIKAVSAADYVFICTPINLIIPKLKEIIPHLKKGAIVSDVGSTKEEIVTAAEKLMPKGMYFVGGHPMAGKEITGFEAAEEGLFKDKTWLLAPTKKTYHGALKALEGIISSTGAKTLVLSPKTHDLVVATISHLPLAIAASLVNSVASQKEKNLMAKCAASGWRDTTRIASGDPILGVDMFSTNRKAVLSMIGSFKKELAKLEKLVRQKNLKKIKSQLAAAKSFRDAIYP